jgi:hypothetical protein
VPDTDRDSAWRLLAPVFTAKHHPAGFADYQQATIRMRYCRIDMENMSVLALQGATSAIVAADMRISAGKECNNQTSHRSSYRFHLMREGSGQPWLIRAVETSR